MNWKEELKRAFSAPSGKFTEEKESVLPDGYRMKDALKSKNWKSGFFLGISIVIAFFAMLMLTGTVHGFNSTINTTAIPNMTVILNSTTVDCVTDLASNVTFCSSTPPIQTCSNITGNVNITCNTGQLSFDLFTLAQAYINGSIKGEVCFTQLNDTQINYQNLNNSFYGQNQQLQTCQGSYQTLQGQYSILQNNVTTLQQSSSGSNNNYFIGAIIGAIVVWFYYTRKEKGLPSEPTELAPV